MEQSLLDWEAEQVRQLASVWLRRSGQHLLDKEYDRARTLLEQVWAITHERESELASRAAWRLTWVLLRQGAPAEAARWFGRIEIVQTIERRLWPIERAAEATLCQACDIPPPPEAMSAQAVATGGLFVCNLGRFSLVRGAAELPSCRSLKAIQLLRYLLTRDSWRASRDELIDLFWPKAALDRATHNLHVAVNLLRRHIDDGAHTHVQLCKQAYVINPAVSLVDDGSYFRKLCRRAEADWRAGHAAAAEHSYCEAIELYRGDYVVDDPDMGWQLIEQQELISSYLTALDRLGTLYCQQGRYAEAIEPFGRLVARDGYREDIHRALMECYQQLGRRNDAIVQYRVCVETLNRDLGLEPLPETTRLYHRIAGAE